MLKLIFNNFAFDSRLMHCLISNHLDEAMKNCNKKIKCKQHKKKKICETWDPLLLIIPLRLGLNEFNQDYKEPIKVNYIPELMSAKITKFMPFFVKKCFQLKYTVGMIGGKPNQAYYFYGYAGKS